MLMESAVTWLGWAFIAYGVLNVVVGIGRFPARYYWGRWRRRSH